MHSVGFLVVYMQWFEVDFQWVLEVFRVFSLVIFSGAISFSVVLFFFSGFKFIFDGF